MPDESRLVIWGPGIRIQTIFMVILTAVCATVEVFAVKDGKTGYMALFGLFTLIFLSGAVRSFQTRVIATKAGLEVRSTLSSPAEVGWRDIERFDYRGWSGGLALRHINGRWMKLQDYGRWRAAALRAAAQLEEFRRAHS